MRDLSMVIESTRLAPLYRTVSGSRIAPLAYLELDPRSGVVTFGNRMNCAKTEDEQRGLLYRWAVPSRIRGLHCQTIVRSLEPLLEQMVDGFFENVEQVIDTEYITSGHLLPRANRARLRIGRLLRDSLIDVTNREHVVSARSPDEFVRDRIDDCLAILPSTTDVGLNSIALEYRRAAEEEGVLITGSLLGALYALRDRTATLGDKEAAA
ncbi:hypothetical protein [Bradyrhizobium sp. CCBAU 51765]|uniref:hypothetical protein n=1 Tax=Bradyrhizobium sp. CCBAU 51765 TaxID=1325102 RepID=UPI001889B267|nr:hypothetical protein [Bradyrhizobium sp. CCBAU 51765]QOZ06673.1 hypothetical protein XH96_03420 [Bradyrhizobium sp. CCBAU 51765]